MSLRNVLAAASILLASLFAACSNQAEGERCNRLNNDDDCQEGLVCKSGSELGSGRADTCCPEGASELPECTEGGGVGSTGTGDATSSGTVTASVASSSASTGSSSSTGEGGGGTGGSNDGGGGTTNQGGGGN